MVYYYHLANKYYTHTRAHTHTRTHARTSAHTQTHARTHTYTLHGRGTAPLKHWPSAVANPLPPITVSQSNHGPTRATTLQQAASLVQPTPRLSAVRRKPVFRPRIVIIVHPRSPGRYCANALSLLYWTGPQRWGKGSRATQSFLHLRLWLADFLRSCFGWWEGEKIWCEHQWLPAFWGKRSKHTRGSKKSLVFRLGQFKTGQTFFSSNLWTNERIFDRQTMTEMSGKA